MAAEVQRVNAAALARLLNVVESKIEQLAKDKIIPRPVKGKYELINSVRDYINHLRSQAIAMDQSGVARHLDMSERNLRDVLRRLGIDWPSDVDDIRVAYIRDLREKAAGRGGDDQAELTRSRVRESHAKALNLELQNYERMGRLIDIEEIEPLLDQWVTVARSEVSNAVNKIIAEIKGQYEIEINEGIVSEYLSAAYNIIGAYPRRRADGVEFDAIEIDGSSGEEMDSTGQSTNP